MKRKEHIMIADITTVNTNEFKTVMSQLYKFFTYSNKSTANTLLRPNSFVLSCESACMRTHTKSHTHTHTHTHTYTQRDTYTPSLYLG